MLDFYLKIRLISYAAAILIVFAVAIVIIIKHYR